MHPGQLPPTWVLERLNSPLGRAPSSLISTYFSVAHTFGTNFISFLRVFFSNLWGKKIFNFLKIVWRNLALNVVLHEAVMYDTGNRSNTRRFCTCFNTARGATAQPPIYHRPISHVPNSTQPVSTHKFFNTTRFYTSVFLHKAGPAPPFPVSAHEYISGR